jgi:hypothetical protein
MLLMLVGIAGLQAIQPDIGRQQGQAGQLQLLHPDIQRQGE